MRLIIGEGGMRHSSVRVRLGGNVPLGALCEHHEQVGKKEADKAAGGESKYPRKNHVAGNSPVNAFE